MLNNSREQSDARLPNAQLPFLTQANPLQNRVETLLAFRGEFEADKSTFDSVKYKFDKGPDIAAII